MEMSMATTEPNAAGPDAPGTLTDRLEAATSELQRLEELVKSGELDQRVLTEFRNAVDHIRTTAWAVQKWVGLAEQSGGDPFSVLPIMSAERVRRATQIANDLCLDIQCADVGLETKGIVDLYNAVGDLHHRIGTLLGRAT
jgi:hypothetical protein